LRKLITKFKGIDKVKKNIFYVPVDKALIGFDGLGSFSLSRFNPYIRQVLEFIKRDHIPDYPVCGNISGHRNNPTDKETAKNHNSSIRSKRPDFNFQEIEYAKSFIKNLRDRIKELIRNGKFNEIWGRKFQEKLASHLPPKVKKQLTENFGPKNSAQIQNLIYIPYRGWIIVQRKTDKLKNYIHYYCLENPKYYPRQEDFHALKKLTTSILEQGYQPGQGFTINSSYIQGTLLKDGWDFKCHISSGRRRAAALAALGFKKIPVIFYDNRKSMNKWRPANYHHILDKANSENWLVVKHDIYPPELAQKIFQHHFEPDEERKARILGLY